MKPPLDKSASLTVRSIPTLTIGKAPLRNAGTGIESRCIFATQLALIAKAHIPAATLTSHPPPRRADRQHHRVARPARLDRARAFEIERRHPLDDRVRYERLVVDVVEGVLVVDVEEDVVAELEFEGAGDVIEVGAQAEDVGVLAD